MMAIDILNRNIIEREIAFAFTPHSALSVGLILKRIRFNKNVIGFFALQIISKLAFKNIRYLSFRKTRADLENLTFIDNKNRELHCTPLP